ncbi:MAG: hypothetical protein ABIK78_06335, partial [candidate division WOR-3 bacterium]
QIPVRIIITPYTSSLIYISERSNKGFTAKADIGDLNATFDWIAIGRAKGYEIRPNIIIPDDEALDREIEIKRQKIQERREKKRLERIERRKLREKEEGE